MCAIQQTSSEVNTFVILISLIYGFWAFIMVFFACEIAQRNSNATENIDYAVHRFDWYLFPLKLQRILPTVMMNTRRPIEIICFGSIACNRATFKKVSA